MPNMIRKKMGSTRAASAISEPVVPVAIFFSLTTFHSLLHARGRARLHTHPANFALSFLAESRNLFSADQTADSSTAFHPPRAEDRTSLGMTGHGVLVCASSSSCYSPGLPACV